MNEIDKFKIEVATNISGLRSDLDVHALSRIWMREITRHKYAYNFSWLGRPAIQVPQDMVALQELVWRIRPDLIIETGIAHGGSLILSASLLTMLDYCDAVESGCTLNPLESHRSVIGIDIDIRDHNREAIEAHPMSGKIQMIQGSSIDPNVVENVRSLASKYQRTLVLLDSNHTHEHVLAELNSYAPLVGIGSYCVVYDTLIEDMPGDLLGNRPWRKGNNPKTAVNEFLLHNSNYAVDYDLEAKILISVAPGGYLRRVC